MTKIVITPNSYRFIGTHDLGFGPLAIFRLFDDKLCGTKGKHFSLSTTSLEKRIRYLSSKGYLTNEEEYAKRAIQEHNTRTGKHISPTSLKEFEEDTDWDSCVIIPLS